MILALRQEVGRPDTDDRAHQLRISTDPPQWIDHSDTSAYAGAHDGSINRKAQQFWGARYIDDSIARRLDRDNSGDWSKFGSMFFSLTDALFHVRTLVGLDTAGGSPASRSSAAS